VKDGWAGLKTLCQRMGLVYSPCRGMYLELRLRPVGRGHARPQPRPAATGTEEGQRSQPPPRCRSGPPATESSGPSWTPRATPSPSQLSPGPRGRTVAKSAAFGSSDRAAGHQPPRISMWCLLGHPGVFNRKTVRRLRSQGPYQTFLAPTNATLVPAPVRACLYAINYEDFLCAIQCGGYGRCLTCDGL
jgi:hypothetical protein